MKGFEMDTMKGMDTMKYEQIAKASSLTTRNVT